MKFSLKRIIREAVETKIDENMISDAILAYIEYYDISDMVSDAVDNIMESPVWEEEIEAAVTEAIENMVE